MSLIATARALDDERFLWRVRAAQLTVAASKAADTGPDGDYASRVLESPMRQNVMLEAMVAVNPAIATKVDVDEHSTVNTEAVSDEELLAAVMTAWDAAIARQTVAAPDA